MRDYRDAKAMAHTARSYLADHGLTISNSQSLELIAKAFGVADWNTLVATIRDASALRSDEPMPPAAIDAEVKPRVPRFSSKLEKTVQRALAYSDLRKHRYATCEHLLLALTDDPSASRAMIACRVDIAALKKSLTDYIDNDLRSIVVEAGTSMGGSRPTAAFQRVMQRAEAYAEQMGQQEVNGDNVLVVVFAERLSPAVRRLYDQDMSVEDAANFVERGIAKRNGPATT
jgi:Glyoxalase superfamily protein/Clp amino terminal domain, pathogenicity island component